MNPLPDKVHLVGSVNLDTAADVFRICGTALGRRLRRIPDGETGPRRVWLMWQYWMFASHPALQANGDITDAPFAWRVYRLAEEASPGELHFGAHGYAHAARASYLDFLGARDAGDLAPSIKFQVCLPTPYAVVWVFCRGQDERTIEVAYTQAMLRELATICASIPHSDLAIQWDVCPEMIAWDGQLRRLTPPDLQDVETELVARIKRLCEAVPSDIDAGVHFCYGDPDGKHLVEPRDAGKEVERGLQHDGGEVAGQHDAFRAERHQTA